MTLNPNCELRGYHKDGHANHTGPCFAPAVGSAGEVPPTLDWQACFTLHNEFQRALVQYGNDPAHENFAAVDAVFTRLLTAYTQAREDALALLKHVEHDYECNWPDNPGCRCGLQGIIDRISATGATPEACAECGATGGGHFVKCSRAF